MKFILNSIAFVAIVLSISNCGVPLYSKEEFQNLSTPEISYNRELTVLKTKLTDKYTILFIRYENVRASGPNKKKLVNEISFSPEAILTETNGTREFEFIKAQGITIEPKKMLVHGGESVDFVVYFRRLEKGIEHFGLYECEDRFNLTCWNIDDISVSNPSDSTAQK